MNKKIYLTLALCALVCAALMTARVRQASTSRAPHVSSTANGAHVSSLARALRPNYPYSVIPGGAYTPDELRAAIQRDPLLRHHFSDFNLAKLHLVKLTEDHYAFVSFRRNGQILWTRRKLKIPQGEILLTDGVYFAKTRCGNRLAESPPAPRETADVGGTPELEDTVLSPPPLDLDHLTGLQFVQAPAEQASGQQPRVIPDALLQPDHPASATPLEAASLTTAPVTPASLPDSLLNSLLTPPNFSPNNNWSSGAPVAAAAMSLQRADFLKPAAAVPEPSAELVFLALLCWFVIYRLRREPNSML